MKKRIGLIISGESRCLPLLLSAEQNPDWPGEVSFVLTTGGDSSCLAPAAEAGIPVGSMRPDEYASPILWELGIQGILELDGVDVVVAEHTDLSQRFRKKWPNAFLEPDTKADPESVLTKIREILC